MNVQLIFFTYVLVNMEDIVGWQVSIFFPFLPLDFLLGVSEKKVNKGNNKITELRTILQRESQNS